MTPATGPDLACFGYLAYAQVFGVTAYPAANSGTRITQIIPSLAGDAPIAALTARQLGTHTNLVSNLVSLDPAGPAVLHTLDTIGVAHQAVPVATSEPGTPQLTIVTDEAGTRTWFAWLGTATDQLNTADPTPLTTARLAYIVITLGKHGAFARTATDTIHVSAPSMAIRHTHGAGAACSIATARCAAARHIPQQRTHISLIKGGPA